MLQSYMIYVVVEYHYGILQDLNLQEPHNLSAMPLN